MHSAMVFHCFVEETENKKMILGYVLAVAMGVLLGLLGGGGSILSVPILVYLLAVPQDIGPSYSLFVVGIAAGIGVIPYFRQKKVSFLAALLFGIPSTIAVFVNQRYVRPAIPENFELFGMPMSRGILLMTLFAVMMILAAYSMIRKKKNQSMVEPDDNSKLNIPVLLLAGLGEGLFSGLVGAGGGFIIVPALVIIARLPMKTAVGTSLFIMSVKSLIGFTGAMNDITIDWEMLLPFTGLSVIGILIGAALSKRIPAAKLKPIFGWFVLAMGTFVIVKTIIDAQS